MSQIESDRNADSMCNFANEGKLQTQQNQQGERSHKEHKTHLKKRPLIDRVTMSPISQRLKCVQSRTKWHNGHHNNKKLGHQSRPSKQVY